MITNRDALAGASLPPARTRGVAGRSDAAFGVLVDGLNGIGSLLIFAMMLLVGSDVVGRSLFNQPIYGVAELVSLSIVAIVFLQLGSTLRHQRMTRADLFIDGFIARHRRAGLLLNAAFNLAGLAACLAIATATYPLLVHAWTKGQYIGVEGLFTAATWPVRLIVIVGSVVTAIQYLIYMLADFRACARRAVHSE